MKPNQTPDWVKWAYGFVLIVSLVILAIMVARESAALQSASNGDLQAILTIMAGLATAFGTWAFGRGDKQ